MTLLQPAPPAPSQAAPRVLLADDSAVVRGLIAKWLETEGFIVCGVARNGRDAAAQAKRHAPDVVVLDVEMPELDGLSAIPQILEGAPKARILMSSTLTQRNAEVTLKALAAGASDYIAKPTSGLGAAETFRRDLIARVRALSGGKTATPVVAPPRAITTRGPARVPAEIIVIGSSTGGPQALQTVLPELRAAHLPILVVQHMPPMFTAVLAEHLAKRTQGATQEAQDGAPVLAGRIYIAPGDRHMRVERRGAAATIRLDSSPPINFCRPAVDPLFQSAAQAFGAATLALVLTGMGQDGRAGAEAVTAAGGTVVAQDEATSVVWGMPGAVAQAGLAAAVRPLNEIAPTLLKLAKGKHA